MIQLTNSRVAFDKEAHIYSLDGKVLKGITTLIKTRLFPEMYTDVPESILQRAAARGTKIHDLCEIYDSIGEGCEQVEVKDYIDIVTKNNLRHLATEYIVTDGETFASGIDKVYEVSDSEVILADLKTTYKLKTEYVTWQLSIYKYLFERQNPGIKVKAIYAIWLKEGKSELVELTAYDAALIEKLLYTDEPMYEEKALTDEEEHEAEILEQEAYWSAKKKELVARKKAEMYECGEKARCGLLVKYSLSTASVTQMFNEKKFAADQPELYKAYLEEKEVAPRFTATLIKK